jgi:glycerol-3-phosphate O-acyltransferase
MLASYVRVVPFVFLFHLTLLSLVFHPLKSFLGILSLYYVYRWQRKALNVSLINALSILKECRTVIEQKQDKAEFAVLLNSLEKLIAKITQPSLFNIMDTLKIKYTNTAQALVYSTVVTSKSVLAAIQECKKTKKDVMAILESMSLAQSSILMRILYPFLRLSLRILFPLGVQIPDEHISKLKKALTEGDRPVLLLPCHKSHLDYMVLHGLCVQHGLPVPLCIAGNNLNMPVIGPLMQRSGAIFIRRSFAGDPLYGAVFKEHTLQLLKQNQVLECFIEGGRARAGKLLPPKIGFLKAVVDPVLDGQVNDLLIVPISICYDRIVEAPDHVAELTGGVKTPERFWSSVHSAVTLLHLSWRRLVNFGRVDVAVGDPISVKSFFETKTVDSKSRTQLAMSLGFANMHEINRIGSILPTMLVGTILLLHKQRGISMESLVEQVSWLSEQIVARGGRVRTGGSISDAVNLVVDQIMMRSSRTRLIKRHKTFIMTGLFTPIERMELATFRNSIIHLFVIESVLCLAHRAGGNEVSKEVMLNNCAVLSALFKLEFIFKPATLQENFDSTLSALVEKGLFTKESDKQIKLDLSSDSACRLYDFLCNLLFPFVESYFVAAVSCLGELEHGDSSPAKTLVTNAQTLGEKLYFEEKILYFEAISKETLQNAISAFTEDGSLEATQVTGSTEKPLKLKIKAFEFEQKIQIINSFRENRSVQCLSPVHIARRERKEITSEVE